MTLVLAITRQGAANYVNALFTVYIILIFIRILMTWLPRVPYNPALRAAIEFVAEVTDPYLHFFRRVIPPVGGGGFAIDLSPILAMIVLFLVQGLVVGAIQG